MKMKKELWPDEDGKNSPAIVDENTLARIAVEARERAEEIEQLRKLPGDFSAKIHGAGFFKLLIPKEMGGLGGDLLDWLRVSTTLSQADASTGWVVGQGAITTAIFASSADQGFVREFLSHPAPLTAWSNYGKIEVQEAQGGLRVSGRWKYNSGCTAASHLGGMIVYNPPEDPENPRMIVPLVRAEDVFIDENWDTMGLAGSGSHDVVFDDVMVPWRQILDWPAGTPTTDFPLAVFVPGVWTIAISAAVVHLGLARRALDETRDLLKHKLQRWSTVSVLEHPSVLRSLEKAEGLLFAAWAGVESALMAVRDFALEGRPLDEETRMNIRLAAVTAVWEGTEIVQTAFRVAGADAIHRSNVLQRLLRDANCLTQHVSVNEASFETIGRLRAGIDELSFKI